jgi:hypothetical protein
MCTRYHVHANMHCCGALCTLTCAHANTNPCECRLAGGLGWLAVLAVGSIGEQVKTRLEVSEEERNTKEVR